MLHLLLFLAQSPVDDTVAGRFFHEYPKASAALVSRLSTARGSAGISQTDGKGRAGQKVLFTFFVAGPTKRKYEFSRSIGRGSSTRSFNYIDCSAGRKSFRLERDNGGPYRIERIGQDQMDHTISDTIFWKYFDSPWAIHGTRLSELMKADDFRLTAARELDTGVPRIVEIEFTTGTLNGRPSSYRVRLDPEMDWAIVESEFRPGSSPVNPESLEIEYPPDRTGGRIFPGRVRAKGLDGKRTLCEFERVESVETPAGEFTLGHYGLKDVTVYDTRGSSRFHGWLIGAGVVVALFAGSVALKRAADRRR